jgi:hypothetical protein
MKTDLSANLPPEVEEDLERAADEVLSTDMHVSAIEAVNAILDAAAKHGYYLAPNVPERAQ